MSFELLFSLFFHVFTFENDVKRNINQNRRFEFYLQRSSQHSRHSFCQEMQVFAGESSTGVVNTNSATAVNDVMMSYVPKQKWESGRKYV